jgi:hypothetical protein
MGTLTHRSRSALALAAGVLALLASATAASAGQPAVAPKQPTKRALHLLHVKPDRQGPKAQLQYMDPSGRVDSLAYCTYTGGLQQMTPGGGITETPRVYHASTGNPYRVIPTIAGEQLIAFRINVVSNSGYYLDRSHWYWAVATNPAGYFKEYYSYDAGMSYMFVDSTTGAIAKRVDTNWTPSAGAGVRFTMDVAWYTNGNVSRQTSLGIPWTTGNVGASCWN